jgi:hypothetical protein
LRKLLVTEAPTDRFVSAGIADLHPLIRQWVSPEDLRIRLRTQIESVLHRLGDRERAREFRSLVPVAGARVEDYFPKLVTVGGDAQVLAGVRFRGGRSGECFVEIYAATARLDAGGVLREVAHAVAAQWEAFRPRCLRIRHANELSLSEVDGFASVETDHVMYAAPIGIVREAAVKQRDENYALTTPARIDFYSEYLSAYDSYHQERPELRGVVAPEDENLLEELRRADLLKVVRIDGIWQGVIAARAGIDHGMQGFLIVENCLAPSARQRELSASLLKEFISGLPAPDDSVVFGTIHPKNIPSARTAQRIGRRDVMRATLLGLHSR